MQLLMEKEEGKTDINSALSGKRGGKDRYQCNSWWKRRRERQISMQLLMEKKGGKTDINATFDSFTSTCYLNSLLLIRRSVSPSVYCLRMLFSCRHATL